jgi:hypothetical protein
MNRGAKKKPAGAATPLSEKDKKSQHSYVIEIAHSGPNGR